MNKQLDVMINYIMFMKNVYKKIMSFLITIFISNSIFISIDDTIIYLIQTIKFIILISKQFDFKVISFKFCLFIIYVSKIGGPFYISVQIICQSTFNKNLI